MSRFTWYRLARWCLVLIRNGWLTPGWSTSWAAAASSPSMMSDGVRKLASWITHINHNKNMNSKYLFFFLLANKPISWHRGIAQFCRLLYTNVKYLINFVNNILKVTVEQTSMKISDYITHILLQFFLSPHHSWHYRDCCYRSAWA